MKIAKLNSTPFQNNREGHINHYFEVIDSYNFSANTADDVTSIETLYSFYSINRFDYEVLRSTYKTLYIPNWTGLTFEDKQFLVKHYCYPDDISDEEWLSYYTNDEHFENWNQLVDMCRDTRLSRLFAAFKALSYYCTKTQTAVIYMTTKEYCVDYYYSNLPHLLYWITNGGYAPLGIDFTNSGFAQFDGYSDELKNKLVEIILNGKY